MALIYFYEFIFSCCLLVESATMTMISSLKQQLKPKELQELKGENFPCLIPDSNKARGNKGNRCFECMPCCYWNVITYFNQKTIDALVKCTRLSLDLLKRRMQPPSKYNASSESGIPISTDSKSAFFKVWHLPVLCMQYKAIMIVNFIISCDF